MFGFNERSINLFESCFIPNDYWKGKTLEYQYWFRSLLHKIDSSIIFKGLPEKWSNDFLMFSLWVLGYVAVFKTDRTDLSDKFGNVVFQPCTLSGFDFYYRPTKATIANGNVDFTAEKKIGEDCEILKLTPDYKGVFDILDYYASKLAELSKGIDMSIINAKFPLILTAKNEAQASTLKKVYDKIQNGQPMVVYDNTADNGEIIPSKDPFEVWNNDYKQTYILHNLLEDMQNILNSFYSEIGLPVAVEKKERLITSETDFTIATSQARISCWIETLKESLEVINSKYGLNIEVIEYVSTINTNGDNEGIRLSGKKDN